MTKFTGKPGDTGGNTFPNLDAIASLPVTTHNATKVIFHSANGNYNFTGTGFGGFNANGVPSTGTITSISGPDLSISGFSLSFATVFGWIQTNNVEDFQDALFSGNDTFISNNSASDDAAIDGEPLFGFAGNDTFDMTVSGGREILDGGDDSDTFKFGAALVATDTIDGGSGNDTLSLNGGYAGLVFSATTMVNVEALTLSAGHNYNLTLNDANVTSTFVVKAGSLGALSALTFNGSAETAHKFSITAGAGDDNLTTGAGADVFNLGNGGVDTIHAGGGNDSINFVGSFTGVDVVDGGSGTDTLTLDGNYALSFASTTMINVEKLTLTSGHTYNLHMTDANVAAGKTLTITAPANDGGFPLNFYGALETNGHFRVNGSAGHDIIACGQAGDTIFGGLGTDEVLMGNGSDVLIYHVAGESASNFFDQVMDFNFAKDKIDLDFTVGGIDAAYTGAVPSGNSYDTNMGIALTAGHLAGHHAVIFNPSSGQGGEIFLVIDMNGTAGYQSGSDIALQLFNPQNIGSLSAGNFI